MLIAKKNQNESNAIYASRYMCEVAPKYDLPDEGMPAGTAQRIILDELNLNGNPALNTASFVTIWMEPEADDLLQKTSNINFIDFHEYPTTLAIHQRVVNMTADILHAPREVAGGTSVSAMGTATVGSSEAIMLGLLAHKWSWKKKREAAGLDASRPNVIFGADVHSCWEKFALYFDVEQRVIPLRPGKYVIGPDDVEPLLDESTIAVGVVVGTTFTGQNDDFAGINELLIKVKAEQGWDIPMHVDGASGGFVMAFVNPEVAWDFRLEQVRSINVSNHKFGLVYPGMGSIIFRDQTCVPDDLIFKINYLGGEMLNYSLNFSRSASQVYLQYYNFLRLGRAGYTRIMTNIMSNAHYLEERLMALGRFDLLTDRNYLPVVVLKLKDDNAYTVFQICEVLRERGWAVPAYTLPPDAQDIAVMRVVVKENFSRDMAEMFSEDVERALKRLDVDQPNHRHPGKIKKHPIC
ncbi:glutamate decarboxylase [Candidatus Methylospira mobilis]|uniref:Glutamate decarboxylase n=1 Tax=Candidatus Methylospira mobilis TaxID=1808979 RepID=A0A5Q0BHX9_9GAMM|nr:glutamate decarboxylase [Candidatus Methylospira mobilis]QFY41764.1 glutamate decarboxylase [Candidatus Methylospira mobilis]WNV06625.1 glutamate decarboxylase [Candidatus Methylospira mobilis]